MDEIIHLLKKTFSNTHKILYIQMKGCSINKLYVLLYI